MSDTPKQDPANPDPWAAERGLASPESSDGGGKKAAKMPKNLFEFIREFYVTKGVVGEKYRDHFQNLEDRLSGDQLEALYELAVEKDPEFGKTLSLAEFLLETSGRRNQRDQIMTLVQYIASNAGSLSVTDSNEVFQQWSNGNRAVSDKLSLFFDRIERITDGKDKKGNLKKLAQKPRNNLGCIAAIWLYYKDEATISQLINHLMKSGMNLKGEAGQLVQSRAFAFLASMIKSTNRKKFSYFLDHVGRNEHKLVEQYRSEAARSADLTLRFSRLNQELEKEEEAKEQLNKELIDERGKSAALEADRGELKKQLQHASIHHGADLETVDSQYSRALDQLMKTLELAQTAMSRGPDKAHVLKAQLEEMARIIEKEKR